MKRRTAHKILGIWLALGLFTVASCAPATPPPGSSAMPANPGQLGSLAPEPETHIAGNAPVDSAQSTALTNYLHSLQLPLVGGRVLASNGGPRQAILYGYVATPFGRADAVDKAREFLGDSGAQVENRIKIEPDLAGPAGNPNNATADNLNPDLSNPDIQRYQQQQNQQLTQQQQQYMNQGSPFGGAGGSPLMMMLPLLGLGFGGGSSGFGMGGGGGSGFSFGGGGFGGPMGSPYGYPSSPPSYGNPYGP